MSGRRSVSAMFASMNAPLGVAFEDTPLPGGRSTTSRVLTAGVPRAVPPQPPQLFRLFRSTVGGSASCPTITRSIDGQRPVVQDENHERESSLSPRIHGTAWPPPRLTSCTPVKWAGLANVFSTGAHPRGQRDGHIACVTRYHSRNLIIAPQLGHGRLSPLAGRLLPRRSS